MVLVERAEHQVDDPLQHKGHFVSCDRSAPDPRADGFVWMTTEDSVDQLVERDQDGKGILTHLSPFCRETHT